MEELLQRAVTAGLLDKPTVKTMLARIDAKAKAKEEAHEQLLNSEGASEKQIMEAKSKVAEKDASYNQEISQIRLSWEARVKASRCTCSICECAMKIEAA